MSGTQNIGLKEEKSMLDKIIDAKNNFLLIIIVVCFICFIVDRCNR
jgi:hypothetical protein